MLHTFRRTKYPRPGHRNIVPDWMGYPGSDYSRYDPYQEDATGGDRKGYHALEGAGRQGWDYDQNRGYAYVHGNRRGAMEQSNQIRDHRGKGPRNYQRTDERILEDIIDNVSSKGLDVSDVEIRIDKGEVSLSGSMPGKLSRRVLEDVVEDVAGVRHVENGIRVNPF